MLNAVELRNQAQKKVLGAKIKRRFGKDLSGKKICVWGLAFKPGTDDMREASSIILINELVNSGAEIFAYDPVAMEQAKTEFPKKWFATNQLQFTDNQYSAATDADALILVTEWKTFRQPDFARLSSVMNQRLIFDGRNQYDPEEIRELGFEYHGIGREKI